jgi:hypothetical protein
MLNTQNQDDTQAPKAILEDIPEEIKRWSTFLKQRKGSNGKPANKEPESADSEPDKSKKMDKVDPWK